MTDNYVGFQLPYDKTPPKEDNTWHRFHDFRHGWGYKRNKDTVYDSELRERSYGDVWETLSDFAKEQIVKEIHAKRQETLEAVRKHLAKNPIVFDTIDLVNVKKPYPTQNINDYFKE